MPIAGSAGACNDTPVANEAVLGVPVFSGGGRTFTWGDVVSRARAWGDWQQLEARIERLLELEQEAIRSGTAPSAERVTAAVDAFRYEHRLLAGDELQQWLGHWDIAPDELSRQMRLQLLDAAATTSDRRHLDQAELDRATWAAAVCSGAASQFAQRLAEQVAVHLRLMDDRSAPPWAGDGELELLESQVESYSRQALTPTALKAELTANMIGWTRVDYRQLSLGSELAAREAALCIRQDGRAIEEVARDAAAEPSDRRVYIDEVEPALRVRLLAANPGELLGPIQIGNEYRLVLVAARVLPRIDDEAVRERAARGVVQRLLAGEVSRQVRWHEHL